MMLGSPPSRLLGFEGVAAWIFDLTLLSYVGKHPGGGVAELVKNRRGRRLRPAQRKRLYAR